MAYLQGRAALDADNRFAIIHDRPPERGRAIKVLFFLFHENKFDGEVEGGFWEFIFGFLYVGAVEGKWGKALNWDNL